jgi:hypothetical protein
LFLEPFVWICQAANKIDQIEMLIELPRRGDTCFVHEGRESNGEVGEVCFYLAGRKICVVCATT